MKVSRYLTSDETLLPTKALLLYESDSHAMATAHDVLTTPATGKGDKPRRQESLDSAPPPFLLGAGKPITREALTTFMRKVEGAAQARALLPESLLAYEPHWMLWWLPSARRPIFFNAGNTAFNKAVSEKHVLHPPLLFQATPKSLSVWALPENVRPTAKTALCRAPYHNLYDAGNMCAGSVKLPDNPVPGEMALWQEAFFLTNFTHTNYTGKFTAHPDGHEGLWREMLTTEATVFPADYLLPANIRLEKLLKP